MAFLAPKQTVGPQLCNHKSLSHSTTLPLDIWVIKGCHIVVALLTPVALVFSCTKNSPETLKYKGFDASGCTKSWRRVKEKQAQAGGQGEGSCPLVVQ